MVIFKNVMHSNAIYLDYWIFGIPVNFASQGSTLFHPPLPAASMYEN